ncbi:MAG: hypothetical protein HY840_06265 [Bacteroidetes bacterium]|nr:hypothetical protein [Bacteroidota bacterium]
MKVLFVGLPYFAKRIVRDLNSFSPQHSFLFYDTYTSKIEQIKFAVTLPFADIVVSLNGVSDKSGSLDLTMKLKKKILMHWQGSDVLFAMEEAMKENLNKKYIDYSYNFTDAPWMREELNSIGINCGILEYKWLDVDQALVAFQSISAYSYLAKRKEVFYGWDIIMQLADKHPDIDFFIAGTDGKELDQKKNIHFLGWISQEKMAELRTNNPIFLRLPKHDGYSLSVLEAMSSGNEVIWSKHHVQCHHAINLSETENAFNKAVNDLKNRNMQRNTNNMLFVKNNLSKEKILNMFIKRLEEIVAE